MKPLRVSENIVPLGEFKTHAAKVLREMKTSQTHVVITQNGKATAVLLTPEEFDLLTEQAMFVQAVKEGLAQADRGELISDEELGEEIDRKFGPGPKKAK